MHKKFVLVTASISLDCIQVWSSYSHRYRWRVPCHCLERNKYNCSHPAAHAHVAFQNHFWLISFFFIVTIPLSARMAFSRSAGRSAEVEDESARRYAKARPMHWQCSLCGCGITGSSRSHSWEENGTWRRCCHPCFLAWQAGPAPAAAPPHAAPAPAPAPAAAPAPAPPLNADPALAAPVLAAPAASGAHADAHMDSNPMLILPAPRPIAPAPASRLPPPALPVYQESSIAAPMNPDAWRMSNQGCFASIVSMGSV